MKFHRHARICISLSLSCLFMQASAGSLGVGVSAASGGSVTPGVAYYGKYSETGLDISYSDSSGDGKTNLSIWAGFRKNLTKKINWSLGTSVFGTFTEGTLTNKKVSPYVGCDITFGKTGASRLLLGFWINPVSWHETKNSGNKDHSWSVGSGGIKTVYLF